jgi:NAD+ kinase
MNVAITGLEREKLASYIRKEFPEISIVRSNPEFILCYGGDGTLLYAERQYPGIPKVMIRNSRVCNTCARLGRDTILKLLIQNKFYLTEHYLLKAQVDHITMYGLNDIIVGHANINTSLRFVVYLNDEQYGGEYLGDGVIVATPLGSTAYYQSVTHSTFQSGLGVAFNNTVNSIGHLVVADSSIITVKVNREAAIIMADNDRTAIPVPLNTPVTIQRSDRVTSIVCYKEKNYHKFNIGIGENRVPLGYCQICTKLLAQ